MQSTRVLVVLGIWSAFVSPKRRPISFKVTSQRIHWGGIFITDHLICGRNFASTPAAHWENRYWLQQILREVYVEPERTSNVKETKGRWKTSMDRPLSRNTACSLNLLLTILDIAWKYTQYWQREMNKHCIALNYNRIMEILHRGALYIQPASPSIVRIHFRCWWYKPTKGIHAKWSINISDFSKPSECCSLSEVCLPLWEHAGSKFYRAFDSHIWKNIFFSKSRSSTNILVYINIVQLFEKHRECAT